MAKNYLKVDQNRFDLPKFIDRIKNLSLIDMVNTCEKEYSWAESILPKVSRDDEYTIRQYYRPIRDFVYFLNIGGVGSTTGKEGLRKFEPSIKNLVEKNQLSKDALKSLE